MLRTLKPRTCSKARGGCGLEFTPARPMQRACSPNCARNFADLATQKREAKARKDDRRQTRAQLEALKTVPVLKKEAQEAFHKYVRLRDNGGVCFVCGCEIRMGGVGGGFDAGHIRARSEADHLRYDERNVWGQCKPCNAPGSTKLHVMREAADRKLGPEVADALYSDNRVVKWTREGLREIRDTYRRKARELGKV